MKKLFLLIITFACISCAYAQTDPLYVTIAKSDFAAKQVIPTSPIAAELGKYGNVPVSLFTGTPNISIPCTN